MEFAYSLNSEQAGVVKDFVLAAAGGAKKGELVRLNSSGLAEKALASGNKGFGVVEGTEFTGLAQGGEYAATNASKTASVTGVATGVVKVRTDNSSVYRIAISAGSPVIGGSYDIAVDGTTGVQTLVGTTSHPQLKVVDIVGTTAFVTVVNAF